MMRSSRNHSRPGAPSALRNLRTPGRRAARGLSTLVVGAVVLTVASSALAAHPKRGSHFKGTDSASPINGFPAPVSFAVSANGKTLSKFRFSTLGCFGAGGFRPGIDYYTQPEAIVEVGKVKVSGNGSFSVSGAAFVRSSHGIKTTTTTTVRGSFTSPSAASGSITFSQKDTGKFTSQCGPGTLTFTAKAR